MYRPSYSNISYIQESPLGTPGVKKVLYGARLNAHERLILTYKSIDKSMTTGLLNVKSRLCEARVVRVTIRPKKKYHPKRPPCPNRINTNKIPQKIIERKTK